MTLDLKEFNRLKSRVESLQRTADKAQGALEQTMVILKDDFECDAIEEAQELARQYEKNVDSLETRFRVSKDHFMKKWKDKLE